MISHNNFKKSKRKGSTFLPIYPVYIVFLYLSLIYKLSGIDYLQYQNIIPLNSSLQALPPNDREKKKKKDREKQSTLRKKNKSILFPLKMFFILPPLLYHCWVFKFQICQDKYKQLDNIGSYYKCKIFG